MPQSDADVWLHCSACRRDILFVSVHWVCSVSTCNRSRTRLVFCSVACWDSHLSTLRHRDAGAVESRAPTRAEHTRRESEGVDASATPAPPAAPAPRRPLPAAPPPSRPVTEPVLRRSMASPMPSAPDGIAGAVTAHAGGPALSNHYDHDDVLIVVTKVKKYIRDRSGMNTSDAIADALGNHVRQICDEAIRAAARDGRKTVLDRDVPRLGSR